VSEFTNSEVIEIVEYEPRWATTYQQEKEIINVALSKKLLIFNISVAHLYLA
jgi:GrpB-like predicted nucleotidyltransferase (UPF0157 family)